MFLLLVVALFSLNILRGNCQAHFPVYTTVSQITFCHGDPTIAAEDALTETFDRFGCAPGIAAPQVHDRPIYNWDYVVPFDEETLRPEPNSMVQYCDPTVNITQPVNGTYSSCDRFIAAMTERNLRTAKEETDWFAVVPEEVTCAAIPFLGLKSVDPPIEPTPNYVIQREATGFKIPHKGRCRFKDDAIIETNKKGYKDLKIYKRETFNNFPSTLGKNCSFKQYNERNISEMWNLYLTCPFDTDAMDAIFNKVLEEAYFHPTLLQDLCLESYNLEECDRKTEKCKCLRRVYTVDRPNDWVYTWNFSQISEGKRCGQAVGNPCTHNVKDLINATDPFYQRCDRKGSEIESEVVLPDFDCEIDAACQSKLQSNGKCTAGTPAADCVCECVEGYECSDKHGHGHAHAHDHH